MISHLECRLVDWATRGSYSKTTQKEIRVLCRVACGEGKGRVREEDVMGSEKEEEEDEGV